ncbi:TetR/AcrR family transcriptional regulator [Salisediminibacterium halotolerans]|uniref:TetR/AcrR family transcriptional regulator n=1 Tax=Salisediminibacterium halotolerans TaxID=517425 RepID=UPI000EB1CC51|nr:TetR/AcrR family transcriptional regulator [Salisediminibacterium halotolerans]RLJ73249.1 TetR family transcriptional regulator [Actinophytocola xinjiangensis]RPE86671.1 TetR family transcriptional regulator [Salisediminibacterium halotolerans]TWG34046.1 TetR family transcriptional regulator [Salisediminibacterium halotolerans]GEL09221.1 hypothetical protein SHA02_26370 [Salisediminibacterium halotolerans]
MSRKRSINQIELFAETEKLVLEKGYNGFHFKALAERLGVARSTIYNYYPKKEELITAYMIYLLNQVIERIDSVFSAEDPLKIIVHIWARYANLHQMLQIMPYIDHEASDAVNKNVQHMFSQFEEMKRKLTAMIEMMQSDGRIRTDISVETIVGFVMAMVQVPIRGISEEDWADNVYILLTEGISLHQ